MSQAPLYSMWLGPRTGEPAAPRRDGLSAWIRRGVAILRRLGSS